MRVALYRTGASQGDRGCLLNVVPKGEEEAEALEILSPIVASYGNRSIVLRSGQGTGRGVMVTRERVASGKGINLKIPQVPGTFRPFGRVDISPIITGGEVIIPLPEELPAIITTIDRPAFLRAAEIKDLVDEINRRAEAHGWDLEVEEGKLRIYEWVKKEL